MAVINLGTEYTYVLDESSALQTAPASADNYDADVALSSLPLNFQTFLSGLGAAYQSGGSRYLFAADVGAAHSAASAITVTSSGPISQLILADKDGAALNGDMAVSSTGDPVKTLQGNTVFLYATSDPHIVIGREGTGSSANASGDVVFAVYLDANGTNTAASLWTVLYEPLWHPETGSADEVIDLGNSITLGAPGDIVLNLGTLASGQLRFGSFGDAKDADPDAENAVIVIAKDLTTSDGDGVDTTNTSQGGGGITIGVSNQMFDPGEGAYFTFVTGMTGTSTNQGIKLPSAGSNEAGGDSKIVYDGLYSSSGASFTIVQIQGGGNSPKTTVKLTALNETAANPQGAAFVSELGNDSSVKISAASVTVTVGGAPVTGWQANQAGNSVIVTGIPVGATVRYGTVDANGNPALHNRVLIENDAANPGSAFDIGGFGLVGPPAFKAIGQLIGFGDDGPVAAVALSGGEAVSDESVGANLSDTGLALPDDEAGHSVTLASAARLIGWDQAVVVTTDGTATGNDGGSTTLTLTVNAQNNDSGLKTTDDTAILLFAESGVVVGRAGSALGEAIFALSLSADGTVTLEQYDTIRHSPVGTFDDVARIAADRLFAMVSVTDGDGDTASDSVDIGGKIGFEDDGPAGTLVLNATPLTVDESVGVDAGDPNAHDEQASADPTDIGYIKVLGSTLFTTTKDYGEDEEGATALFSLKLTSSATSMTVSNTGSPIGLVAESATSVIGKSADDQVVFRIVIDAAAGDVTVSQYLAIEHGDATNVDELSASLGSGLLFAVYTVTDGDGDKVAPEVDIGALVSIEDDGPTIDQLSVDNLHVGNIVGATDSGAIDYDAGSDQSPVWKISDAPDSNGFTFAYADVDLDGAIGQNEIVGKLNGTALYSLIVNPDGTYDFTLLSALSGFNRDLDVKDIKAGGPDTNFIDVGTLTSDDYVRISGFYDADGPGGNPRAPAAVNESNANVGVVNGNLDANETLSFSLYAKGATDPTDISGISIGTKTAKSTSYTYKLYDDGAQVGSGAVTVGKNGVINIDAPVGVLFDTVDLLSVNGSAVKIGLADIHIKLLPPDYTLNFELSLVDADNDPVLTTFTVDIDGNGDGAITSPIVAFAPIAPLADFGLAAFELTGLVHIA